MPDSTIPFDQLPPGVKDGIFGQCSSIACKSAKDKMSDLRLKISAACTKKSAAQGVRDAYAAVAAACFVAAAAFAAAGAVATATIFGIPAAAVLFVAAAAMAATGAVFAGLAAGWQAAVGEASGQVESFQKTFSEVVKDMRRDCSEYCYADESLPSC